MTEEMRKDTDYKDYKITITEPKVNLLSTDDKPIFPEVKTHDIIYRFYKTGKSHPVEKIKPDLELYIRKLIFDEIRDKETRSIFEIIEDVGFEPYAPPKDIA